MGYAATHKANGEKIFIMNHLQKYFWKLLIEKFDLPLLNIEEDPIPLPMYYIEIKKIWVGIVCIHNL